MIAFCVAAGVAVAAAQQAVPRQNAGSGPGATSQDKLDLSQAQKSAIFQAVSKEKAKVKSPPNVRASIGAEVPASAELHMLPDSAVANAPAATVYRYTIVQNEVVLVDPTNMRIVEIIRP
jgi:hypothetical protein